MGGVITDGRAVMTERGWAVYTARPDLPNISDDVQVIWQDSRHITQDQRKKAWAIMSDIAEYQGERKEDVYSEQQSRFTLRNLEILQDGLFHLSTATVSTARAFITMLIDIVIEYGIPTKQPLTALCDDLSRYVYSCLINKKCAVCGLKADTHHCQGSTVGMGRNRREMIHEGLELMPLCRAHHMECHNIGQNAFNEKYHLQGVKADKTICKKLGLKYAD